MALEVVLGIDIGGTFTKIGLVDREGSIHFEDEISTRGYETIENAAALIWKRLDKKTGE